MIDPRRDPLDSWLDSAQSVEPSAQLRRAIAEVPLRHPRSVEPLWPFGSVWKTVSVALVICALGVFAGAGSVDASSTEASVESDDTDIAFAISLTEGTDP